MCPCGGQSPRQWRGKPFPQSRPLPPVGLWGDMSSMISVPNANWADTMYDPYKQCQYFLRQLLRWFALYRIINIECR
ncbi:MAG: hypothetical protein RR653_13545, partial [Clostridia bacterium]